MASGTYHLREFILAHPDLDTLTAREVHHSLPAGITESAIRAACWCFAQEGLLARTDDRRDGSLVFEIVDRQAIASRKAKGDQGRARMPPRPEPELSISREVADAVFRGCADVLRTAAKALEIAPRALLREATDADLNAEVERRRQASRRG